MTHFFNKPLLPNEKVAYIIQVLDELNFSPYEIGVLRTLLASPLFNAQNTSSVLSSVLGETYWELVRPPITTYTSEVVAPSQEGSYPTDWPPTVRLVLSFKTEEDIFQFKKKYGERLEKCNDGHFCRFEFHYKIERKHK